MGSIVESDLRLAITDALDNLLVTAVAASGFQAPGTDNLLASIRKARCRRSDADPAAQAVALAA